jgi:hypothetical protein
MVQPLENNNNNFKVESKQRIDQLTNSSSTFLH